MYCDWSYNWGNVADRPYDGNYMGTGAGNVYVLYYYGRQDALELMVQLLCAGRFREYSSGGVTVASSDLVGLMGMPSWLFHHFLDDGKSSVEK